MSTSTTSPLIPTSGSTFFTTGRAWQFRDWLHAVRGDLPHARCTEIAERAGEALEILGAAAPHVIPADPAAAESFLAQVDLPLVGLASDRLGKLKRAVRGMYSWVNGLDGDATRQLMDRAGAGTVMPSPSSPTPAAEQPAGAEGASSQGEPALPLPESHEACAVEVPPSFAMLESAVIAELARRKTTGERAGVLAAGRAILHGHRADVRRQIAVRTAEAFAISPTAFVKKGVMRTPLCDAFLLLLLMRRDVGMAVPPASHCFRRSGSSSR